MPFGIALEQFFLARAIVAAKNREIELYQQYKNCYGYGGYIAKKLAD